MDGRYQIPEYEGQYVTQHFCRGFVIDFGTDDNLVKFAEQITANANNPVEVEAQGLLLFCPSEDKAYNDVWVEAVIANRKLARINAELERIRTERERLGGKEANLRKNIEELRHQRLSPVLVPRTKVVGLRLNDAIERALRNNPDYMVQLHAARSSYQGVSEADGRSRGDQPQARCRHRHRLVSRRPGGCRGLRGDPRLVGPELTASTVG